MFMTSRAHMSTAALVAAVFMCAPSFAQTPPRTTIAGSGDFAEQADAPAVRANYGRAYVKMDGRLYFKDDSGVEYDVLATSPSAASILASIITVDGSGSLVDADFLDGVSGDGYCLTDGTRVFTGNISFEGSTADSYETTFSITDPTADRTITFKNASGTVAFLSDITNMSANDILVALLTVDGPSSGINADLLDDVDGTGYGRVTTMSGVTCADNGIGSQPEITLDITCPAAGGRVVVPIINNDTNGCYIEVLETSAALGCTADIYLAVDASGATGQDDKVQVYGASTDVLHLEDPSAFAYWQPALGDALRLVYADMADDVWRETSRSGSADKSFPGRVTVAGVLHASAAALLEGDTTITGNLINGQAVVSGNWVFEGATADAYETTLAITDPTADRTITFKNESGTVAFTSDIVSMSAADILAALITVDGASSGLDADLLDGSSSAAFAALAGGNTFAASNTYAANDITDADVVDTLTCSNYAALAGGNTFASSNVYAADDITDADVSNTITASNYLPLAGGTLTSQLSVHTATTPPALTGRALSMSDDTQNIVTARTFSSTGFDYASVWQSIRGRGTGSSPAAVSSGDILGSFSFGGYYSASLANTGASIAALATENFVGANNVGTRLLFQVKPNAGSAMVDAFGIASGAITAGSTTANVWTSNVTATGGSDTAWTLNQASGITGGDKSFVITRGGTEIFQVNGYGKIFSGEPASGTGGADIQGAITVTGVSNLRGVLSNDSGQIAVNDDFRQQAGTAKVITSPTDTSTSPVGAFGCRMSSSGGAAWTPSETNAVDGMLFHCINTSANDITMTDSDGVYEGPGSVVGQWDAVTFQYITDRWVEVAFSNNEP